MIEHVEPAKISFHWVAAKTGPTYEEPAEYRRLARTILEAITVVVGEIPCRGPVHVGPCRKQVIVPVVHHRSHRVDDGDHEESTRCGGHSAAISERYVLL